MSSMSNEISDRPQEIGNTKQTVFRISIRNMRTDNPFDTPYSRIGAANAAIKTKKVASYIFQ